MADGVIQIITASKNFYIQDVPDLGKKDAARMSATEVVEGGQVIQTFKAAGGEETGRQLAFSGRCSESEYDDLLAVLQNVEEATIKYYVKSTESAERTWNALLHEVDGKHVIATDWVDVAVRFFVVPS